MLNKHLLFDFTGENPAPAWQPIDGTELNDLSNSRCQLLPEGGMHFSGIVLPETINSRVSARSPLGQYNVSDCSQLWLRLRGDGKSYKLNLRTNSAQNDISYQLAFTTAKGRLIDLQLPLSEFRPVKHGRPCPGNASLDPADIKSIGLLISERQTGSFEMALFRISAA